MDKRTRNWNFIVYPDSAPSNWVDILDEIHVPWVQSPLHDSDFNADGSLKKPHWHCTILFDGVKSFEQVRDLLSPLNCTIPLVCQSSRGSVRYMAHLDNPEKFQYRVSDILPHQGADIIELLKPTSASRYQIIGEIMDFILETNVLEFSDLSDYARLYHCEDWLPVLTDHNTMYFQAYITSRRHRARDLKKLVSREPDENGVVV